MNVSGKSVVIMGLGTLGGGAGSARFFAEGGARVTVTDLRTKEELASSIKSLSDLSITYVLGEHREKDFQEADLIIKNPSVSSHNRFILAARKRGVQVEMAESLFIKLTPTKQVIGVTGTRGKSTTTALIANVLKDSGFDTHVGGNVKDTSTLQFLNKLKKGSVVVLELSSWQLESFGWHKLSPHISVVTNIYPDHLNRYATMEEYVEDKLNCVRFQKKTDVCILNRDNEYSDRFAKLAQGNIRWFSKKDWPSSASLLIPGEHNRENAAAALVVGKIFSIPEKSVITSIQRFSGLPHRLETVRVFRDVTYVNDSASTTPIAGIVALNAYPGKKIILITGGNSKNIPLDDFVSEIKKHDVHTIYFAGTAQSSFQSLQNSLGPVSLHKMKYVLEQASNLAKKGDIVLFSPATTHLPFVNEFERGERFKHEVNSLH